MDTSVLPFRNPENFAKLQQFYFVPGTRVILFIIKWLYEGKRPIEENLIHLAMTSSSRNKNQLNLKDKLIFEELADGHRSLNELDITLLYKVVQICCFETKDNIVWTKQCPKHRREELEHLLFRLKEGRNCIAHPSKKEKDLTDLNVDEECEKMKKLLTAIIEEAGQKTKIDTKDIKNICQEIEADLERIRIGENMSEEVKCHIKKLILNDLRAEYASQMDSFSNKNAGKYSAPEFRPHSDPSIMVPLKNMFSFDDSQIVIVTGEFGKGKTELTKFLFNCWLTAKMEPVNTLDIFDIVFRVECKNQSNSDIQKFYEDQLRNTVYKFSNTSSMSRHLSEYKVLWLMDGFDERARGFIGFLKDITKIFPESHKMLITTRPNTFEELKQYLSGKSVLALTLENLNDNNITEIITNLIKDKRKKEIFKAEFSLLDVASKLLLRIPYNLTLHIELWLEDQSQAKGSYTTSKLLMKMTKLQLRRLQERLKDQTTLHTNDLKTKVKRWFYGNLCKESFRMIIQGQIGLLSDEAVTIIKKGANGESLIDSECVSCFLAEGKINGNKSVLYYHHQLQQFVFAYFFLRKFEKYLENSLEDILIKVTINPAFVDICFGIVCNFLDFYLKLILENNSSDLKVDQTFQTVHEIIAKFEETEHVGGLWYTSCNAMNFIESFMQQVRNYFQDTLLLDLTKVTGFPNIKVFLNYIQPKKIKISTIANGLIRIGYQDLMDYLNENEIEVHIFQRMLTPRANYLNTEIDLINNMPLKIIVFIGKVYELSLMESHFKNLKAVGISLETEEDVLQVLRYLYKRSLPKDIKMIMNFQMSERFVNRCCRIHYYEHLMQAIFESHNKLMAELFKPSESQSQSLISPLDLLNISPTIATRKPLINIEERTISLDITIHHPHFLTFYGVMNEKKKKTKKVNRCVSKLRRSKYY